MNTKIQKIYSQHDPSHTWSAVPELSNACRTRRASYHIPSCNSFLASFRKGGKQKNEEAARPSFVVVGSPPFQQGTSDMFADYVPWEWNLAQHCRATLRLNDYRAHSWRLGQSASCPPARSVSTIEDPVAHLIFGLPIPYAISTPCTYDKESFTTSLCKAGTQSRSEVASYTAKKTDRQWIELLQNL